MKLGQLQYRAIGCDMGLAHGSIVEVQVEITWVPGVEKWAVYLNNAWVMSSWTKGDGIAQTAKNDDVHPERGWEILADHIQSIINGRIAHTQYGHIDEVTIEWDRNTVHFKGARKIASVIWGYVLGYASALVDWRSNKSLRYVKPNEILRSRGFSWTKEGRAELKAHKKINTLKEWEWNLNLLNKSNDKSNIVYFLPEKPIIELDKEGDNVDAIFTAIVGLVQKLEEERKTDG